MRDALSKVSDLARISLCDIKKSFLLLRLVSFIDAMNREDEKDETSTELSMDIPTFGKLKITEDFDFVFVPDMDFKKDAYQVMQNPEAFLKKELRKLLKIESAKGE